MAVRLRKSPCATCKYRDPRGLCTLLGIRFSVATGVKKCYAMKPPEAYKEFAQDFVREFRGMPFMSRDIAKTFGLTLQKATHLMKDLVENDIATIFKENVPRVYKLNDNIDYERLESIFKKHFKSLPITTGGILR